MYDSLLFDGFLPGNSAGIHENFYSDYESAKFSVSKKAQVTSASSAWDQERNALLYFLIEFGV
jgi:hypothetical protein